MKKTFIETREFSQWVEEHLSDEALLDLQRTLLANPAAGAVMPGCGGLRKLRVEDPRRQKGRRGGARVIYLSVEEADEVYLITVYGKDEKDDLSAEDRALYRQLAELLKSHRTRRGGGR